MPLGSVRVVSTVPSEVAAPALGPEPPDLPPGAAPTLSFCSVPLPLGSGAGSLNYLEFRSFLSGLNIKVKPSQSRVLFRAFDESATGLITFFE